jgi:excinuclease ABC subunit A
MSISTPPTDTIVAPAVDYLEIVGARTHNLQNISVNIPRDQLVVITGVSGCGKSSLAFDTIYAEGQRRYLETYSAYIRQFVGGVERPDVDKVNGLSPVISIEQKTTGRNPRSTVGTVTEIYDFLRLLYARIADAYSYVTGKKMEKLSEDEIIRRILNQFTGQSIYLLAPVIRGRKGNYRDELAKIARLGFPKARIDGEIVELSPKIVLDRYKVHDIEIVIDRLEVSEAQVTRLTQSVQTALKHGRDTLIVALPEQRISQWYCLSLMDPESNISYDEPAPNAFSFNSNYGMCKSCEGLGQVNQYNIESFLVNPGKPLLKGALAFDEEESLVKELYRYIAAGARAFKIKLTKPFKDLSPAEQALMIHGGTLNEPYQPPIDLRKILYEAAEFGRFLGIGHQILLTLEAATTEKQRTWAEQYVRNEKCPTCNGARLNRESLHFKIDGKNIFEVSSMEMELLLQWLDQLPQQLSARQLSIAHELIKEIRKRVQFLLDVGLDYLHLNRPIGSLSGGESQRIRLATQIGTQLVGVLYILDEPSIGLHQRDNAKLIHSLKQLRDLGNSVLVVEHDKDMMLESDYIVDIGPGAGVHGGRIVAAGPPEEFVLSGTATADYLNGTRFIPIPEKRRTPGELTLQLIGAKGNNLKDVHLKIPLGLLVCVTGVSGSGKSSLVNQTLYPILHKHVYGFHKPCLPYGEVRGLEHINKIIEIDQKPIGRTPRSNPATYSGVFTAIRELFSILPESQIRGYKPGRFSFNVKGGRCENCGGGGQQVIEMGFLPDVLVDCPACRGKRYNRETLEVRYKGKSISDVLNMTVNDAVVFFEAIPGIFRKIKAMQEVGLGYITLGQPATTLSGGEAQRLKIATELAKRDTGQTFYILDEPTTGLHFQDVAKLLEVLNRLVDQGNTVLVIEHHMDMIKVADWIIDVGPEGGEKGGHIIAEGTPDAVAAIEHSHTGRFLAKELVAPAV